jgi:hypothetical protein
MKVTRDGSEGDLLPFVALLGSGGKKALDMFLRQRECLRWQLADGYLSG